MPKINIIVWIGMVVLSMVSTAITQTITTTVFPLYVDGRDIDNGTPFAVYVEISNWTDAASSDVNVMVTTESGSNFLIWNNVTWKNAYRYSNCPVVIIDSNGNWSGWIYLRAKNASTPFKARARKVGETTGAISESITHSITYMDMSTNGAWVYATAASTTEGKAILVFDNSNNIIGTYAIENNEINEGYSSTAGYFRVAVPANTVIPKLQSRNSDNSIFDTQTSNQWSSGKAGSETNLDLQEDVSLPVTLSSFSATYSNGTIVLRWSTESEVEIRGFNILRSEKRKGPFEQITTALILTQGNDSMSKEYEFVDRNVESGKGYWYKIEVVNMNGENLLMGPIYAKVEKESILPEGCILFRNYPNPFNPKTTIQYHISQEAALRPISLKIYNSLGEEVLTLVRRTQNPGNHSVDWNGRNSNGMEVPSGIYFYQLSSGGEVIGTKRMLKVK